MNAGFGETKKQRKGKGRQKASNRTPSIYSCVVSSSAHESSPSPDEVSIVEKVKRQNEDMAGRYVFKMFCGERIIGLVTSYDNETSKFKIVYEDRNNDSIDKEILLRTLAPPTLVDWMFDSHRMPRLLCILQQKVLDDEEQEGRLGFVFIENDGVDEHMIWLIELKNLFSRQLPHVPKEYIVHRVLDLNHKSVMVIRRNQDVVGGITYRPFLSQGFAEIAFCAVMAYELIKGCGTRLMDHLKEHARDMEGVTHLLTCADSNVVDYFLKQGFTKEITLEKDRWQGYIKVYDVGILMGCELHPRLPYSYTTTMASNQRQAIIERIREASNSENIVYPGIDFQKAIRIDLFKAHEHLGEAGIPSWPIKVEDIPGLKEAGWTPDQYGHSRFKTANDSSDTASNQESITAFMRSLLKQIYDHPDAWPFKEPVDSYNAPGYYDVIKDPMDLKMITTRVESEQYYITLEMFLADMKRMFANARTYNMPHTVYYKCANRLESFFSGIFQSGLQDNKFQQK